MQQICWGHLHSFQTPAQVNIEISIARTNLLKFRKFAPICFTALIAKNVNCKP